MPKILVVLFILIAGSLYAQNRGINDKLVSASFEPYAKTKTDKRKLLAFQYKYAWFNPLNYAGAGLLYVYQNVISEQIQASCMYNISCSEYTKLSIQQFGFVTGVLMGFNQLSECHPGVKYEHPSLFINGNKIVNSLDKENK